MFRLVIRTKLTEIKLFLLSNVTVWAETGDFRDNGHNSMVSVASSLDISQLHFQSSTNLRNNNKNRDRKSDGKFFLGLFTNPMAPVWL